MLLRGIFCGIHLSQDRVDMMMPTVRQQNHGYLFLICDVPLLPDHFKGSNRIDCSCVVVWLAVEVSCAVGKSLPW